MGLPEITVEFKAKAETAVKRSANGIVALILSDDTKTDTTYSFSKETKITKSHWTTANLDYLNLAFKGNPKKVLVERVSSEEGYDDALARLANKKWNYLAIPALTADDTKSIADWIIAQRAAKKTFKAVLANYAANDMGIINFTTENCKTDSKTYTAAEYCARIAGLLAGLALNESATGESLTELTGITESLTPDTDIDNGQFILINDGETIEVGRGVNSLAKLGDNETEDMKSIKIVEGMDLIRDDIRTSYKENYVGRANSLENKELFIAAVNQYFDGLVKQGVLYDGYDHYAEIDVDAQRDWLSKKGDVLGLTDAEIKKQNTGTYMFMAGHVQFQNAAEDLSFVVNI